MSDIDDGLRQAIREELAGARLLDQVQKLEANTPGFDAEKVLTYMRDTGYKNPELAFKDMQKEGLVKVPEKAESPAGDATTVTKDNFFDKFDEALGMAEAPQPVSQVPMAMDTPAAGEQSSGATPQSKFDTAFDAIFDREEK